MIRHQTSTGFIVYKDKILLHFHPKVREWLPPGGHIEKNEDPLQAIIREINEETGLSSNYNNNNFVFPVPTNEILEINNLEQVYPPFSIMIEEVKDKNLGVHQHIDHIYFFALSVKNENQMPELSDIWKWIDIEKLKKLEPIKINIPLLNKEISYKSPPEDVKVLGIKAIEHIKLKSNYFLPS
ncbi:MAG: NUDIX hydrolase [Dehalococcoidia bacterium]